MRPHANGRNVVLVRFAGHRTIKMLGWLLQHLTDFKLYAASANIVVVPCKRTQHLGPNIVACCWPYNVASVCMGLMGNGSLFQVVFVER